MQKTRSAIVMLLAVTLVASGCSVHSRVWIGATAAATALPEIEPGDRVLLLLQSGARTACHVNRIEAERLYGLYGCRDGIDMRDVREVKFREIDGQRAISLSELRPRDRVTVTLRSGEVQRFRVTSVDDVALHGRRHTIALRDIESLQVSRVSLLRTGGLVIGTIAVALLGLLLYLLEQAEYDD